MPIYDQSYAHWEGQLEGRLFRWLPITLNSIRLAFRSKIFLVVFCLGLIPFVIWAGTSFLFYTVNDVANDIGQGLKSSYIKMALQNFFSNTTFGIILMVLFVGCGLIAKDLKVKALEIYFSKPITLFDYLVGKVGVMVFFLSCMTFFPGVLLYLLDYLLSSDTAGFLEKAPLLLGVVLVSLLITVTVSMIALAASSLCASARNAAILWFGFHLTLLITGWILWHVFNMPFLELIDIRVSFSYLTQVALDVERDFSLPWIYPLLYIILLNAGAGLILYRRVRRGEGDES
jgi:ABC-2 type transport system permease protein